MTSPRVTVTLPSIQSAKVTGPETTKEAGQKVVDSQKLSRASTFISRLQLGSLHCQRRPGDVWGGGASRLPRPLGLIPSHQNNFDILKELSRFLPPLTSYTVSHPRTRHPLHPQTIHKHTTDERADQEQITAGTRPEFISADIKKRTEGGVVDPLSEVLPPSGGVLPTDPPPPLAYRYPQSRRDEIDQDCLATYDLRNYYTVPQALVLPRLQHTFAETWYGPAQQLAVRKKQSAVLGRVRSVSSGPHFLSFSEQSQLCHRGVSDDRRLPLPGEPCARCLERGGRCQRCKALRVGGGYLILDGDDLSDDELRKRLPKRYSYGRGQRWSGDGRDRRRRTGRGKSGGVESGSGSGVSVNSEEGDSVTGGGGGLRGEWSGRSGTGHYDDGSHGSGGGGGGDNAHINRSGWEQDDGSGRGRVTSARGDRGRGTSGDGDLSGRGGGVGSVSGDDRERGGGGRTRSNGDNDGGRGTHEGGEGDGRNSSRGVGSRPHSTLGSRPASSLRRGGLDRRTRDKKGADLTGGRGRGRERDSGERDSDSNGSDNGEHGGVRRRRKKAAGDDDGTGGDELDRSKLKFKSTRDGEDERPASGYHGNLMRFKRKKDEVKALHATLQELQGIDPLDYLAKYCIIDQNKLPHYQHCFDNVDRDEDDEIDIGELDFALKAVNYDLISDSEMIFVHSVLELAGRYKLNFRLFSLIAALSEKVVSLEDMVKRLINKMDFEALEVKIKKCKELFYLLADAENQDHEGGVVTTGSLAVELQAGGLTGEHIEFVVERLNHENKGLVEFLDYLTYVPLFVEIHDSIYDNPLDFTRLK